MLSALQIFILSELFVARKLPPKYFLKYYRKKRTAPSHSDQHSSISRSIERLIDRGLCVANGRRTREKWFIDEVRLTPEGLRMAKAVIQNKQMTLLSH